MREQDRTRGWFIDGPMEGVKEVRKRVFSGRVTLIGTGKIDFKVWRGWKLKGSKKGESLVVMDFMMYKMNEYNKGWIYS